MFCYQCQETFKNTGCTVAGVCGKSPQVAGLQDVIIWLSKGLSEVSVALKSKDIKIDQDISTQIVNNLFMTITNANFDDRAIYNGIIETINLSKELREMADLKLSEAATFKETDLENLIKKAEEIGAMATKEEDRRSLQNLITYGIKGLCAYLHHASVLGARDKNIEDFMEVALAKTLDPSLSVEDLTALTLETGENGVKAMALLDKANTSTYGHPEITTVNIGVKNNPGILISGHDLKDMEMLLEQTDGTGVDVYTHSEMLPANYYPKFKKYSHFVGNYGNAWWLQSKEFESFNGPILMTTNCITPPRASYKERVYTTGVVGFPGCQHIEGKIGEKKDFTKIIEHAKKCSPPEEIEKGEIVGGFAHNQVFALADKVVEAVKSGDIKKFVVMAGCDGRHPTRSYYTDFADELPKDTVILTAGCAKYRYNKLGLGDIGGIPRVLDAGQCNDSYSLVVIAMKLQEIFGLKDINDLPIVYNIAWYEQKAVIVLLALLSLGVRDIHLGPTLPAFLSKNVVNLLVENFGIAGIGTVKNDIELLLV